MSVDSFKYLPRLIAMYYRMTARQSDSTVPWTPLPRPISNCRFGLVTSAGLYHQGVEPPFDVAREKREPTWGDPSYRTISVGIPPAEVGASHLHINTRDVLADINIVLPIQRFQELVDEGRVGGLAQHAYSFMGYQGFPPDTTGWEQTSGPQVADKLKTEGVDCVLLTPV